jgi:hypothetical protein
VFAAAAPGLVVASLLVARLKTRTSPAARSRTERRVVREALAGFEVIGRDRRPRLVIALLASELFVLGVLDVLIVVLAFDVFASGDSATGFLSAAMGAGGLLGAAAAVTLIARPRLSRAMRSGMLLCGAPLALIGGVPAGALVAPALATTGAGMSVMDVAGRTMLQRLVPDRTLSRVFGVLEGSYMAAEAVGAVLGAVLVATVGLGATLVAAGLLLPVVVLVTRRHLAEADVGAAVPLEDIRLLHSLPMFAALGPPELERLAQHLFPAGAAAGETIIREGDVGDRFYVVKGGEADVSKDGRALTRLGAGECFGEIALLRDVPRTATVTARTDMELLVLERTEFLAAVTPLEASARALDELVEARLERSELSA